VVPEWEKDYKQKILFRTSKAELVQPMLITIGEIEITATHFYFLAHRCEILSSHHPFHLICIHKISCRSVKDIKSRDEPLLQDNHLPKKNRRWNLLSFKSVLRRSLLYHARFPSYYSNNKQTNRRFLLQRTAFEVFCTNGKTYFFNTPSVDECEKLIKKVYIQSGSKKT